MATYPQITQWVRDKFNIKSTKDCHIAHAKEVYGVPKRPRTTTKPRAYPCPKERLPMYKAAFKHFGML